MAQPVQQPAGSLRHIGNSGQGVMEIISEKEKIISVIIQIFPGIIQNSPDIAKTVTGISIGDSDTAKRNCPTVGK